MINKLFLASALLLAMTSYANAELVSLSVAIGGFLFTNTALSAVVGLNALILGTQISGAGARLISRKLKK
ncbi:MAG: hypothetical protein KUA43_08520 [Hoeflea sp.]|uniref:hypothetical protein n=1 Tax=Hoeflea sp. TaxID=1940281 RepID=UPI001D85B5DC|nr:hypothetical protein [Hoeflea sp.]MBU4529708.1 hypothetical protein [Alphaproteobacteria bacterium]MBU4543269.1 hypothetical protein [Alphaproteobacteria bacterium]MBU4552456.1 hypothetical protein [Alphaproteobacteria bacterium]MBV1723472.1 hypothetical protein [Hoeflea sp.]MBV1762921.1 hypothetical protein [Hoeflea sp.]